MRTSFITVLLVISGIFVWKLILYIHGKLKQTKGCLYGKTEQQKEDFFISLLSFKDKHLVFYNEQYDDLQDSEKDEFNGWILRTKY